METIFHSHSHGSAVRFKSYYVVWKLVIGTFTDTTCAKFKSYYVVWKPQRWKEIGAEKYEFKSYYVVWKLFFLKEAPGCQIHGGLNRTM